MLSFNKSEEVVCTDEMVFRINRSEKNPNVVKITDYCDTKDADCLPDEIDPPKRKCLNARESRKFPLAVAYTVHAYTCPRM